MTTIMAKKILVREIDEEIHTKISRLADQKGMSINSIAKDALEKWIKQQDQVPHKHDLLIYDNEKSLVNLLRTMDRFAKEGNWYKAFCGSAANKSVKFLTKIGWNNVTIKPYQTTQKEIPKYCSSVMKKLERDSKGSNVCCMDFILEDVAEKSLKQAIAIESGYNLGRIPGVMFCPYKTDTILKEGIESMMNLFAEHDQIFVLKNEELHKLHITKENTHKLFMN